MNVDSIKLEALEAALVRFAENLAERGLITFRQAACVFVGIDETNAFIPGEHEPEYDPYDDSPDWLLVMEREMVDRMLSIEARIELLSSFSEADLVWWFEEAEDDYDSEREAEAERRMGC